MGRLKIQQGSLGLFNKIIIKRGFCTSLPYHFYNNIGISERLNTILLELGLSPVYVYENLNLEDTRKQILNDTKGLSGIYMILNKLTKDYSSAGRGLYSFGDFAGSTSGAIERQVKFLENLRYIIIKLIFNVLDTMHIKNRARLLSIKPRSLIKPANINSLLYDGGGSYLFKKTKRKIC